MKHFLTKVLMVESWDIAKQALISALTNFILNLLMMLAVWGFFVYQIHKIEQSFQDKLNTISLNYGASTEYVADKYEDTKDFAADRLNKIINKVKGD